MNCNPDKTILLVRLTPNAKRTGVEGMWNNTHWRISVQAPAVDGKANEALRKFLSKETDVPLKNITITHGLTSRQKTVEIIGLAHFVPSVSKDKNNA